MQSLVDWKSLVILEEAVYMLILWYNTTMYRHHIVSNLLNPPIQFRHQSTYFTRTCPYFAIIHYYWLWNPVTMASAAVISGKCNYNRYHSIVHTVASQIREVHYESSIVWLVILWYDAKAAYLCSRNFSFYKRPWHPLVIYLLLKISCYHFLVLECIL